jgi:hypothetical protein
MARPSCWSSRWESRDLSIDHIFSFSSKDLVTRAVSGHSTEAMQRHYSTVNQEEIRQGLARVISLAGVREAMSRAGNGQRGLAGEVSDLEGAAGRGISGGVNAPQTKTAGEGAVPNRP